MLQLYHVEEQKKKRSVPRLSSLPPQNITSLSLAWLTCLSRWSEVEDLAKQLPNEHADLRPYLTRSNPIVNNYVENKLVRSVPFAFLRFSGLLLPTGVRYFTQASAVVSGSSYPMEWYNLVPQKIDEIKSILFFYKNQQIQKVSPQCKRPPA